MPQGTQRTGKSLAHVLFLSAALSLLSTLVRRERRQLVLTARDRRKRVRVAPRRIAASLAFATLFFAGAALSAGAGNGVVQLIDPTSPSAAGDTTTTTTTTTSTHGDPHGSGRDPPPAEQPPSWRAAAGAPPAAASDQIGAAQTSRPQTPPVSQSPAPTDDTLERDAAGVRSALRARLHAGLKKPGVASTAHARPGSDQMVPPVSSARRFRRDQGGQGAPLRKAIEREPEADEPNVAATVWLHRDLPDPTPPSRRLTPAFAQELARGRSAITSTGRWSSASSARAATSAPCRPPGRSSGR